MPNAKRDPRIGPMPDGEYVRATSGKDAKYQLVVDQHGNSLRLEPYTGNHGGRYKIAAGMPIDPSEWCEASHETCDCNPRVEIPAAKVVDWMYGTTPVTSVMRSRAPRFCVPCFEAMLEAKDDTSDWGVIEARREAEDQAPLVVTAAPVEEVAA